MRSLTAVALLLALCLTTFQAEAQEAPTVTPNNPNINLDDFAPSVHAWDNLGVMGTRIQKGFSPTGGMWLTYRRNALSLQGDEGSAQIMKNQLVSDLYGAVSLLGWASIGLNVPLFFVASGDSPADLGDVGKNWSQASGASLGDLRVSAKVKFWDNGNKGFGIGLAEDVTLPTATGDKFTGEEGLTSKTALLLDYNRSGWSAALNIGYLARKDVSSFVPEIGDELHFSAGLVVPIVCDMLELLLTSNTRTFISDPFGGEENVATNFIGGVKGRPIDGLVLTLAGGTGYGTMPGNPAWQTMLNVGFEKRAKSCDQDNDGLCDRKDKCPTIAGPVRTDGCPDRDRDGVLDDDDTCPDAPGTKYLHGCPDLDKDGLADHQDACPDVAGPKETKGCPDKDGDGVLDHKDTCPDTPGLKQFDGCPDTDGDGIEDQVDDCPKKKGPIETGGCPDKDKDGIKDSADKCPDVWGKARFQGCPPPTPKKIKITKKKIVILEKVFFATGKSKIKRKSYPLLKDVATVLKENPWVKKVQVEGHTDDVGRREFNMKLSQARADSVRKFLIKQGVEETRLEAVGYGPDKPLVNEKTKEARAQNRRVEFSILESE